MLCPAARYPHGLVFVCITGKSSVPKTEGENVRLSTLTPTYNEQITALRDRLKQWQFNRAERLMEQAEIETDPEKKAALEEKADRLLVHAYAD